MYPDQAFWAIVATAVLLVIATIAGYVHGDSWDTISEMITRNERLQNAFAMFMGMIVLCQGVYVVVMYNRLSRIAQQIGQAPTYAAALFVTIGYALTLGGSVGFAIVSTDISQDEHTVYAATAFGGTYMYLLAFGAAARYLRANVLWPRSAALLLCVPAVCAVLYAATGIFDDYMYAFEFIFVGSLLGAACSLYLPRINGGADHLHAECRLHI